DADPRYHRHRLIVDLAREADAGNRVGLRLLNGGGDRLQRALPAAGAVGIVALAGRDVDASAWAYIRPRIELAPHVIHEPIDRHLQRVRVGRRETAAGAGILGFELREAPLARRRTAIELVARLLETGHELLGREPGRRLLVLAMAGQQGRGLLAHA